MAVKNFDLDALRETLGDSSPEALAAATRYRTSADPAEIPKIFSGILARYLPHKNSAILAAATPDTRLIEDLGMDSMGLLEVVLTAEEVFGIRVENHELKDIHTLGEMAAFISEKLADAS
jgi:acyl carrier protein